LNVYRHDRKNRALITLNGEIDLTSTPLLHESLQQCLRDGIHHIDADLTTVTFCDCSGLNTFLAAARQTAVAGGVLRLHHPQPMLVRLFSMTATGFLLLGPPASPVPPLVAHHLVRSAPTLSRETVTTLDPVVLAFSGGVL
jgi:anti-anti-sigma factor